VPDERLPWADLSGLAGTAAEPIIHARRTMDAPTLCGVRERALWTTRRSAVSCDRCKVEIERRLATREERRGT
jgi:hypothetical protein